MLYAQQRFSQRSIPDSLTGVSLLKGNGPIMFGLVKILRRIFVPPGGVVGLSVGVLHS